MVRYRIAVVLLLLLVSIGKSTVEAEGIEEPFRPSIENGEPPMDGETGTGEMTERTVGGEEGGSGPESVVEEEGLAEEETKVVEGEEGKGEKEGEEREKGGEVEGEGKTTWEWMPYLKTFPNATCPNLVGAARFDILVNYQCPGNRCSYACVDDLLEAPAYRRYRCRQIQFGWEKIEVNRTELSMIRDKEIRIKASEVHIATSNFIAAFKERGRHGSNFCMMLMFYAPNCPFSAHWAPYFNALPPRYQNVLFTAVDASDPANSRMNTRLGVTGTPTMIFYVDGAPVGRVDETSSASKLADFVENLIDSHSDAPFKPNPDGNVKIEPADERSFTMLFFMIIIYSISVTYHFAAYTETGKEAWAGVLQRMRG